MTIGAAILYRIRQRHRLHCGAAGREGRRSYGCHRARVHNETETLNDPNCGAGDCTCWTASAPSLQVSSIAQVYCFDLLDISRLIGRAGQIQSHSTWRCSCVNAD